MIVPDVNLLIYSYNSESRFHQQAKNWWESVVNSDELVGISWIAILGFARLVSNRKVVSSPISLQRAFEIAELWLEQENVQILNPSSAHIKILKKIVIASQVSSNLTTDAHLAALAIEHQATLFSNDSDFSRFPGLKWVNPLG